MTIRRGDGPRDRRTGEPRSGAHRLRGVDLDEEHYAQSPAAGPSYVARSTRGADPRRGRPVVAILRVVAFLVVLGAAVLIASLTLLRPMVKSVVVDWAASNPSALAYPFVADLVREDLGSALTAPAGTDHRDQAFTVVDGDTARSIADRLHQAGLLTDARAFVFIATERSMTGSLEVGTFLLRADMTPDQLVTALLATHELAVAVGLREGLRLEQVTAKLETLPLTTDFAAFYDEVRHPPAALLADYPWLDLPKGASLEGYLGAETYLVHPNISADELVRKMLDAWYQQVGPARIAAAKAQGRSFYEVLILASLVEQEAMLDVERPLIAGVYANRLDPKRFPLGLLQSDPTIFYVNDSLRLAALPIQKWTDYPFWAPLESPLPATLPKDLAGYNTYLSKGLMPGPICSPSVASIDAALEPTTSTGYLYFIAKKDGTGTSAFAKTYAQHQLNVAKYAKP